MPSSRRFPPLPSTVSQPDAIVRSCKEEEEEEEEGGFRCCRATAALSFLLPPSAVALFDDILLERENDRGKRERLWGPAYGRPHVATEEREWVD